MQDSGFFVVCFAADSTSNPKFVETNINIYFISRYAIRELRIIFFKVLIFKRLQFFYNIH